MKETIIKCDGCRTTYKVEQYRINCGWDNDPSGNGYNINWLYKDWCFSCFKNYVLSSSEPTVMLKSIEKC